MKLYKISELNPLGFSKALENIKDELIKSFGDELTDRRLIDFTAYQVAKHFNLTFKDTGEIVKEGAELCRIR
jgi:hypothetical protein